MPVTLFTREGATGVLIFPIEENGVAYPSGASPSVQLVLQGLNGKLGAQLISDPTRVYWLDTSGDVAYKPTAGELLAAASPYQVYVRIYASDGTWVPAPNDYYLLIVQPSGF